MYLIQIQWVLNIFGYITAKIYFSVWWTQCYLQSLERPNICLFVPLGQLLHHQRELQNSDRITFFFIYNVLNNNNIGQATVSFFASLK